MKPTVKSHSGLRALLLILTVLVLTNCQPSREETRVLVFSKTAGFRHEAIKDGIEAIQKLGKEHGFLVDTTENSLYFHEDSLSRYSAVIFLNTTGDVLDYRQQKDFERYIQAGGGFVGVHSATDTEYDWPWYGKLVGAYFNGHPNHPNVRVATMDVVDKNHLSTEMLPDRWEMEDEWYNFRSINPDIHVLINLDETTYEGGTNGENHPIAWAHEYDGGRAFYTGLGHEPKNYSDPLFLEHLYGGIKYAIGKNKVLDYSKARTLRTPEENRFVKVILDEYLDEPMELAVTDDGRVFFVERNGNVRLYDPEVGKTKTIYSFDVFSGHENGLLGFTLDPNFSQNGWAYFFYSPTGVGAIQRISRFEISGDSLIADSEKIVFEFPFQIDQCCHSGGSLAFGPNGNLFISIGDNTNPFASFGYSPMDEREGREPWDAQRTSANTNDYNGKILRIKPEADGTYSIPDGNLFPKDGSQGLPEIYVMGNRNPFRISIDQRTGYLYWGEVGPDAGKDSIQGPKGYDEVNQAKEAGFFGWPYFIANNKPYRQKNFADNTFGELFDPAAPVNNSVNNTGLKNLPPAQGAMIYYPYDESREFPLFGQGGRNSMAGPVYYYDDYEESSVKFPKYYDGKFFIYDWMRNWIMAVTLDENGDFVEVEPFLPNMSFDKPIDMQFDKNGALYIIEYGTHWFAHNVDSRLVKIEYNATNRKPVAIISADKTVGAAPLKVNFSAEESYDYDNDKLKYEWHFTSYSEVQSTDKKTSFTFEEPGMYLVRLKVTDASGEVAISELELRVGNEPPVMTMEVFGNSSFYWDGDKVTYKVTVTDKEDGSTEDGSIPADQVRVFFDYLEQGSDITLIAQGHQINTLHPGQLLIDGSDCKACHGLDVRSVGPSYLEVAERYKDNKEIKETLVDRIIKGSSGVWGQNAMSAHPQLSTDEVGKMVDYILTLGEVKGKDSTVPLEGAVEVKAESDEGIYILTAEYRDQGANGIEPIAVRQEHVLRHPSLRAVNYDGAGNMRKMREGNGNFIVKAPADSTYFYFKDIDLTDIKRIVMKVKGDRASGSVEVYKDGADGRLLGVSNIEEGGWKDVNFLLPGDVKGRHDLYFIFRAKKGTRLGSRNTLDVESIFFSKK